MMAAAGDLAVSSARSMTQAGGFILVVEGGIQPALADNLVSFGPGLGKGLRWPRR